MSTEEEKDGGRAPASIDQSSQQQAQTDGQAHDHIGEISGVQERAHSQVEGGGDGLNHRPSSAESLRHPLPPHSSSPQAPHAHGDRSAHEGFVKPSSYLRRPRGLSRPMPPTRPPETGVDREQRRGLVSILRHLIHPPPPPCSLTA